MWWLWLQIASLTWRLQNFFKILCQPDINGILRLLEVMTDYVASRRNVEGSRSDVSQKVQIKNLTKSNEKKKTGCRFTLRRLNQVSQEGKTSFSQARQTFSIDSCTITSKLRQNIYFFPGLQQERHFFLIQKLTHILIASSESNNVRFWATFVQLSPSKLQKR